MPGTTLVAGLIRNIVFGIQSDSEQLPDSPGRGDAAQGLCAVMSSVSLTTATFASSSGRQPGPGDGSGKRRQLLRDFATAARSYSLTGGDPSGGGEAAFRALSAERRFSFDDILDEKEEDVRPERTSSLSQLLDLDSPDADVKVEHRSRDFFRQCSRTSSTETVSSEGQRSKMFSKKTTQDMSSSLSSLSSKVTISSKAACSKSSQSAQNLHQAGGAESRGCHMSQFFRRKKQGSPCGGAVSPSRPPPAPKQQPPPDDGTQEDLDLLAEGAGEGGESPERALAVGRVIARMGAHIEALRAAAGRRGETLEVLGLMNDLVRRAWAVSTVGYDLGSSLCKDMLANGAVDILLRNFDSEDERVQFESARLLEQCLVACNRERVAERGLGTVVRAASRLAESPCGGRSRVGAGILEHLLKAPEATCGEVMRLGGLAAVLYACRNTDVETLRHCAAALANLSLHGGHENQEAMIQHKAPEWLFPLAFHDDANIKYYACLAIAALVANKEIEAAVLRSGTLDLVEPFVTTHTPDAFARSTVAHAHGQSQGWLRRLVPVLRSKREEARSLAAFHFAMEAGIKKRQNKTKLFHEIGVIEPLRVVASSPNSIASRYAAHALQLIGEPVPHKLSQQVPLWTVEDVVEWVKQIGFPQHSQEFSNSRVDGDLLLQVTEKSLEDDIRITNGILRKRFLRELNQLRKLADYSSCDPTGLGAWLQSAGGPEFCRYTYQMLLSGVHGGNLRDLSPEQLQGECGIANSIHRMRLAQAIKGMHCNRNDFESDDSLNQKNLDVFISYRRSNGSQLASLLKVHLQLRGFSVFIDVERLEAGKFDSNLLQSVRRARHFILVLTPNALDRCLGDADCKDWVHREIVEAVNSDCNIIPILDNFKWPDPDSLPEDMRTIPNFNGVTWSHDYQDACVDKLERFMRGEPCARTAEGSFSKPHGLGPVPRSLPHSGYHRSNSNDSDSNSNSR